MSGCDDENPIIDFRSSECACGIILLSCHSLLLLSSQSPQPTLESPIWWPLVMTTMMMIIIIIIFLFLLLLLLLKSIMSE